MSSQIAQYNLERDKNVLGKDWLSTYGNYFSDEENIQMFIEAIKPFLPDRPLDILYMASASGLLGEKLVENLGQGNLTIVDISQKHLDENKNSQTKKICADLLELDLDQKFDLIIMRSALDYFPSKELQTKVLQIIKDHLEEDGLFVNQPAYISNIDDRDYISKVYNTVDKIGNRLFQSSDLQSLYEQVGFKSFQKIGEGKIMNLTEEDHIKRYNLTTKEVEIIQNVIKHAKSNAEVTESGYNLQFEFPIFLAKSI